MENQEEQIQIPIEKNNEIKQSNFKKKEIFLENKENYCDANNSDNFQIPMKKQESKIKKK